MWKFGTNESQMEYNYMIIFFIKLYVDFGVDSLVFFRKKKRKLISWHVWIVV